MATAVAAGDRERLGELFAADADPNLTGRDGVTLVQFAIMTESETGLHELLTAGADPDRAGLGGEQPVFTAVFADNENLLRILLEEGADPDARASSVGQSALSRAVLAPAQTQFHLLMAAGADVNLANANGDTALHSAARSNAGALILELLEAGADPEATASGTTFQEYYFTYPSEVLNQRAKDERQAVISWLEENGVPLSPGAESWPDDAPQPQASGGYRVLDALGELPAADGTNNQALIVTGDVDAASGLADLGRPDDPSSPAVAEWVSGLTASSQQGASGVFVPLPEALVPVAGPPTAMQDLVGWSVIDVASFAAVGSPPDDFAVISGSFSDDTLPSNLKEVDDGIVTDREGEDGEVDLTAPSPLSRVGVPTRLAQQGDRIAYSASTDKVRGWLDDGASLADDDALRALAQSLDDSKVYAAVIAPAVPGDGLLEDGGARQQASGPRDKTDKLVPQASFDAVGIGWAADNDGAVVSAAYHFASDDTAESAAAELRELFTAGSSIVSGKPISDYLTVEDVRVDGPTVVVATRPADGAPLDMLYRAIHTGDTPFISR